MQTYWFYLEKVRRMGHYYKDDQTEGAIRLDRRTRVDIKENQMAVLRFQTGGWRH